MGHVVTQMVSVLCSQHVRHLLGPHYRSNSQWGLDLYTILLRSDQSQTNSYRTQQSVAKELAAGFGRLIIY